MLSGCWCLVGSEQVGDGVDGVEVHVFCVVYCLIVAGGGHSERVSVPVCQVSHGGILSTKQHLMITLGSGCQTGDSGLQSIGFQLLLQFLELCL